ncbi:MAG: oxygen-dependent coproporphyrinogen oxidase [Pseudomonadota bacterium]
MSHYIPTDAQKSEATEWFKHLRDLICKVFEDIEDELTGTEFSDHASGRFVRTDWKRQETADLDHDGGGGEISLMHGRVFEKVGVNISTVYGDFQPEFADQIPGAKDNPAFWASGISLVAHMRSPLVPAVHMNTRHIITQKSWFGGGADLNPMFPDADDTTLFHSYLKKACDEFDSGFYDKFKKWCDEYFYIAHRKEARGVGGIFYDYLDCDSKEKWDFHFAFTKAVGMAFLKAYPEIIRAHINKDWTEAQREHQLIKRGRYAEFNLVYDRGTLFGLKTGGNIDAILMSLPPEAKWP